MTTTINTYKVDIALIIDNEIIRNVALTVGAPEREVAKEIALIYAGNAFPDEKADSCIVTYIKMLDSGIITK